MKPQIQVVCGILHRQTSNGLELALFERKEPKREFEFPGGKIEPGESPIQALRRELQEELNVQVKVGAEVGKTTFEYTRVMIHLIAYWVEADHFNFILTDHHEWRWVNAQTWRNLKIAGPDIPLLEKLFEKAGP